MKIVSNFVDYYDSVENVCNPGNHQIEFIRKTERCDSFQSYKIKSKIPSQNLENIKYFSDKSCGWSMSFFALGFCGKMYRGVSMTFPEAFEVSYTLTGAIYIPSKHGILISREIQNTAESHFRGWRDCDQVFDEIDTPLLAITPDEYNSVVVTKNPSLAQFQFMKTMPSFDAFQKIKAFLGSAEHPKPTPVAEIWKFNPFLSPFLTA